MISAIKAVVIIALVVLVISLIPTVSELPFGLDSIVVTLIQNIKALVAVLPFMEFPLTLILLALSIKFALSVWNWTQWIISLVK